MHPPCYRPHAALEDAARLQERSRGHRRRTQCFVIGWHAAGLHPHVTSTAGCRGDGGPPWDGRSADEQQLVAISGPRSAVPVAPSRSFGGSTGRCSGAARAAGEGRPRERRRSTTWRNPRRDGDERGAAPRYQYGAERAGGGGGDYRPSEAAAAPHLLWPRVRTSAARCGPPRLGRHP